MSIAPRADDDALEDKRLSEGCDRSGDQAKIYELELITPMEGRGVKS